MPSRQQTHIDKALTNISVSYALDENDFIADKVFPIIPVSKQTDVYFIYDKGDLLRDEAKIRANATESAGGDYNVSVSKPYHCQELAFHKVITQRERANMDNPLNLDIDTAEYITRKVYISKENLWVKNYFQKGVWTQEYQGVDTLTGTSPQTDFIKFSKPASNPVLVITNSIIETARHTGYKPNTIVMSPSVLNALRNHPDIIDRIKYTSGNGAVITESLLANLFGVDNIYVPYAISNSANIGEADKIDFIYGNHMLLCYVPKRPGLRTPSAGYTFAWTGYSRNALGGQIIRIPKPDLGLGAEKIECSYVMDQKIVCQDLGVFFSDVV